MLTEDEIRITQMKPVAYSEWLTRTQAEMFRRFGRPTPPRAATTAKAPARTFRTTATPRAKTEAIPPPRDMRAAILRDRRPMAEKLAAFYQGLTTAARNRAVR